jgi:hypothetical protein
MHTHALTATLAAAALMLGAPADAAVYEGFDYAEPDFNGDAGGAGFGSNAWTLSGGGASVVAGISNGSLDNDAYTLSSSGNKAVSRNVAGDAVRILDSTETIDLSADGDVVYFSYLLQSESPSDTTNQLSFFSGSVGANGSDANIVLDTGIRDGNFRLRAGGSSQVITGNPVADTTYFLVGFIDPNASTNDVFGLNVYDSNDIVPSTAPDTNNSSAWLLYDDGKSLSDTIDRIALRATGADDTKQTFYDEIRISDNYATVAVPEPASLALLAAGGVCLLKRRRR